MGDAPPPKPPKPVSMRIPSSPVAQDAPAPPPKPAKSPAAAPDRKFQYIDEPAPPPSKPEKPVRPVSTPPPESARVSIVVSYKDGVKEVRAAPRDGPGSRVLSIPYAKEAVSKDGSEKYMAYHVDVHAGGKTVTADLRFSEFADFHKEWKSEYPTVDISLPPKKISVTDEDVAYRCVELERYLLDMLEVSALVYSVAKLFKLAEADLKAAVKGARGGASDDSGAPPSKPPGSADARPTSTRALPKVSLDTRGSTSASGGGDRPRSLPKVTLAEVAESQAALDGRASPSEPGSPAMARAKPLPTPPPPEPVRKPEPAKAAEPVKKPEPVKAAEPVKKFEPVKAAEPVKKPEPVKAAEPVKKPEPVKAAEPVKKPEPVNKAGASSAPGKAAAASEVASGGGMSVKERMAAFQKKG